MVAPLLLGLDIGTSRSKALLLDDHGSEVARTVVPTPWVGGVELSVEGLQAVLRSALEGAGDARGQVVSVGIAGMAESGAPLDRAGRGLGPIIAWHDPRGREMVARLTEGFGDDLPRWIGQPLRTVSSVAKLGWLVEQGVAGVACWLGVPELCLNRLTGVRVTEHSLAARTGWYHVGRREYLPEVAAAAGVGPQVLAPVMAAGAVMGRISPAGAGWSGLPAGIPVTLAGHDHLVGMAGSGGGQDLVNSVGTAESVVAAIDTRPDVDRALSLRVAVSVMPGGGSWALLAGAARAGIILSSEAERLGASPAELDHLAQHADVCDGGPGAIWNGVLESLSARTWEAAGRMAELTGPAPRLVVFGGGSRSRPWLDHKARLGPMPVWRSTEAEAVARGAALYAGMAVGWWPSIASAPQAALEMMDT